MLTEDCVALHLLPLTPAYASRTGEWRRKLDYELIILFRSDLNVHAKTKKLKLSRAITGIQMSILRQKSSCDQ